MRPVLALLVMVPALSLPAQAQVASSVSGKVQAPDGTGLTDVFVQQQGAFASAVTDAKGGYTLRLDPKGRAVLSFSLPGYQPATLPVSAASTVTLQPIPTYRPMLKPADIAASTALAGSTRFFDTQIEAAYRTRYQAVTARGAGVEGMANHEIFGLARYRVGDAVLSLDGYRNKVPLILAELAPLSTPPSVESSQWNLSVGYAFGLVGLEWLTSLTMSNSYVVTSSPIPWTGTPLDYNQTRQGFGVNLEVGQKFGDWTVAGRALLIPSGLTNTTSNSPYDLGSLGWGELAVQLGYCLMPGLEANVAYSRSFGGGAIHGEWANVGTIGLSYHPERIQP